jgi:hypothetical protein
VVQIWFNLFCALSIHCPLITPALLARRLS